MKLSRINGSVGRIGWTAAFAASMAAASLAAGQSPGFGSPRPESEGLPDVFNDFWSRSIAPTEPEQSPQTRPFRRGMMLRPLAALSDDELAARLTDVCYDRKNPPPPHVIEMIERMTHDAINEYRSRYNTTTSWHNTTGTPHALTYSFVPDGLHIPANPQVAGDPAGTSNLYAKLDADFLGFRDAWIALFDAAFARWGALTGLSYTRVSDDGAPWGTDGAPGLRGDLRIGGRRIDGNGGILAWNNFPNNTPNSGRGDMCIDTHEISWFNPFSNPPARMFSNVLMHEHGHGMGLLHVCPITNSKLMEPYATEAFFGPQHDDIRGAQRLYGDAYENNEDFENAAFIGNLSVGQVLNPSNPSSVGITQHVPANVTATSIDGSGDVDYFRVRLDQSSAINVSLHTVGYTYDSSPQFGQNCGSGNNIDSHSQMQLRVEVYSSPLVNAQYALIGSQNASGVGGSIFLTGVNTTHLNVIVAVSRIGGSTTQSQMYNLAISAGPVPPPANNLCSNPTPIEPGILIRGSNAGATTTLPRPSCAPSNDNDVWFSLVPRGSGTIVLGTCGSEFFATLTAYTGDCGALTEIACSTTGCSTFQGLIQFPVTTGTVYRIRLDGGLLEGAYNLYNFYLPPANDLCANALPLPVNSWAMYSNNGALRDGDATCVLGSAADVWYRYTPANEELVTVTACSSLFDPLITVFTGSCGSLTQIACDDDSGQSGGACAISGAARVTVRLPANQQVLFRVASVDGITGDFGLDMSKRVYNDLCADAPDVSAGMTYTGSTVGAMREGTASCVSTATAPDVWFKYTPTCTHTALLDTCGSSYDTVLSVYTGACGSLSQIACNDDSCGFQSRLSVNLTGGVTYYIRLGGFSSAAGAYVLNIGQIPAPANDSCQNAAPVTIDGLRTFDTTCASADGTASCGASNTSPSIWYTYVSSCTGTVRVNTCGSSFDTVLSAYAGNCGAMSETACNDDAFDPACASIRDSRIQFSATQGSSYLVRVSGFNGARGAGNIRFTCGCVADMDDGSGSGSRDGGVTIEDLLFFLQAFDAGLLVADVDDGSGNGLADGGVTIDDLLYYLARFDAGC